MPDVERGVDKHDAEHEAPSIATAQAGLHLDDEEETPAVVEAIRSDPKLTGRQRQALLEVYDAFVGTGRPARRRRRRPEDGNDAEEAGGQAGG